MDGIAAQISLLASIVLALISAFFMVRILVLIVAGQIDLAAGRPGALADLAVQVIYLLVTLMLAVNAQTIGTAFAQLALARQDALLSGDLSDLSLLLAPASRLVLGLAANLAIAMTVMAVAFIALRGQLANLFTSSQGVSQSVMQALTAFAILTLGMIALVLGRSLLFR